MLFIEGVGCGTHSPDITFLQAGTLNHALENLIVPYSETISSYFSQNCE